MTLTKVAAWEIHGISIYRTSILRCDYNRKFVRR